MSFHNKKFYIAAYNSSGAGNAASSRVLGGDRDAKRSLHFTKADYSSEEDSPYAPAVRKARALELRRNVMAAEETAKSNSLFQKMGITGGGDSDDDDEEEEVVVVPEMLAIEEEAAFTLQVNITREEFEAMAATHEQEMSTAKGETELLSKKLAAATNYTETLTTQIQAERAAMEDKLKKYGAQVAESRRLLEEKNVSEQASAADEGLKIKVELLERQVATLQASGERAEAERSVLAAENAELNDRLSETLAQVVNTKEHQIAQKREQALRKEVKGLQDELSVVQSALKASNEAASACSL